MIVRDATEADAAACAAIYAPYVRETAVSFELRAADPGTDGRTDRRGPARHAWLVLEDDGRVVGYAYGQPLLGAAGVPLVGEVSIYLDRDRHRTGGGRLLYEALLERLAERGYRRAMAGMTPAQRRQRRRSTVRSGSSRSASIAGSAGSTVPGTTSPGCRRTIRDAPIRRRAQ